jgi:hypothetical protein
MKIKHFIFFTFAVLVLSSCGKDSVKNLESVDEANESVSVKSNNQSDLSTIKSPETGEIFTENDGDLIPSNLILEDINVFMLNYTCENESMPDIISRVSYDYDGDSYNDAAIVVKCPEASEYGVIVFRATSRGWWNKFTISPSFENIKIVGGCDSKESILYCEANRYNKVSDETIPGFMYLSYERDGFIVNFNSEVIINPELVENS